MDLLKQHGGCSGSEYYAVCRVYKDLKASMLILGSVGSGNSWFQGFNNQLT